MKKTILFTALISLAAYAQDAQTILNENGCMACHAVASKKTAPAFAGIARRNLRFGDAQATIINSIKNGSSGKYPHFSDTAMPPYPNLTDQQLETVSLYILSQASKAKGGHGGGKGKRKGKGGSGGDCQQ